MTDAALKVLRDGFFPQWTSKTLLACLKLLETNDSRIIQILTTQPPPFLSSEMFPVEMCDLVAFCSTPEPFGEQAGYVSKAFACTCAKAVELSGNPDAARIWLNAYDDGSRADVWQACITEIRQELQRRSVKDLDSTLQNALLQFPEDQTLKLACVDALIEQGLDEEAETLRAITGGLQ